MVSPIDFIVMNIWEETEILILLGRPFFVTVRAIIDVKRENLTLEVGDENIEFLLDKLKKIPTVKNSYCRFDIIKRHVDESPFEQVPPNIVKAHIMSDTTQERKIKEVKAYKKVLDGSPFSQNKKFEKESWTLAQRTV